MLSLEGSAVRGTKLSVGFRPSQVVINDQETRAYVVSKPGISVIDLSADVPAIEREIFLPEDDSGQARDVSFTPDGAYAFVRLARQSDVVVIRTADDERVTVALPREVTDLDLSGDGSVAVAVMRGSRFASGAPELGAGGAGGAGGLGGQGGLQNEPGGSDSQIAILPVPQIFTTPDGFDRVWTEELVGSTVVSHDASVALLFTSAVANSHLTVLRLDTHELRTVDLQAPTQAAFVSRDGQNMVAVMTPPAGSARAGAFALMRVLEDRPPRIEGTSTVPRFVALSGDRALVTTWGSQTTAAEAFLGSFPRLSVDRVELTSEPLASGMIPEAGQGFVAQAHPEGRVTFVDFETSAPATVTGFELASKAVE